MKNKVKTGFSRFFDINVRRPNGPNFGQTLSLVKEAFPPAPRGGTPMQAYLKEQLNSAVMKDSYTAKSDICE
jgi:hypothetical protein